METWLRRCGKNAGGMQLELAVSCELGHRDGGYVFHVILVHFRLWS